MKIYDLVYKLLKEQPELRNSDKKLLWKVWEVQGRVFAGMLSYESFLKANTAESITRARRKVQELYPELQAVATIKIKRDEKAKTKGTWIFRENSAYFEEE